MSQNVPTYVPTVPCTTLALGAMNEREGWEPDYNWASKKTSDKTSKKKIYIFNNPYDNGIIKNELPIIKSGCNEESNENELSNNEYSNSENQTIKKLTLKGQLGSTVFVSTDIFLGLVLNQLCLLCSNIDPKNQKAQIKVDGLQIYITLTCSLCSSKMEYCNEREALLGVTKQNGHQQYFNKQTEFFQSLYQIANKSAKNLLILVCEQLRNKNQDILEELFDCAWSHVCEALQASREFIFNRKLEVSSRANNSEVSTPTNEEFA
ncbi:hypothetical protein C2G38_2216025 [Gigaspora rosea]|uniref:Uncharacterized protein n=1 Tax=Gigaspora rosea TaxID=44941 RepID=A0A397U3B7_9GLOM|nr:hypothetical protein C2G38_2229282 [Gigaspora rosea]RIB06861.1 hypothetical protein C2G38_2216025 [Gigaspora rosea]